MNEREDDQLLSTDDLMGYENPDIPDNLTKEKIAGYMHSKWWRLNHLYWIINENSEKILFRHNFSQEWLWDRQWYLNLLLKARQFGGTTWIDLCFLDDCLFTNNLEAAIIAHNKDDATKIFRRKVLYPYKNLPSYIKGLVPLTTDSKAELAFSNNSTIYVTVSARSATVNRLHISEFGKICAKDPGKATEIITGSLNAIHKNGIIWIESTAEGAYGDFYDMVEAARNTQKEGRELTQMEYKFHFIPWFQDPKNALSDHDAALVTFTPSEWEYLDRIEVEIGVKFTPNQRGWYALKARQQGEKMFREFPSTPDEPFHVALKGAYYAREMTRMREQKRLTIVPLEPDIPVNTFWDLGRSDENSIVFHQRVGLQNRLVDYYENFNESMGHYVKILQEKGYIWGTHYFPHDMSVHDYSQADGKSRLQVFESLMPGLRTRVVKRGDLMDGIEETRRFLATTWIDKENCAELIKGLDSYQREWDEKLAGFRQMPLHNFASHPADALRTGARGFEVVSHEKSHYRDRPASAMAL